MKCIIHPPWEKERLDEVETFFSMPSMLHNYKHPCMHQGIGLGRPPMSMYVCISRMYPARHGRVLAHVRFPERVLRGLRGLRVQRPVLHVFLCQAHH